jgi:hypothetical protein
MTRRHSAKLSFVEVENWLLTGWSIREGFLCVNGKQVIII